MKDLNNFINEKFTINKNTNFNETPNFEDDKVEIDIVIAAIISIENNGSYLEGPTFQKIIKHIKYNDIIDILNNEFGYKLSYDETKIKKGNVWRIVSQHKTDIQNVINGFTIFLKDNSVCDKLKLTEIKNKYKKLFKK